MVGSEDSIGSPNTILNAIVAEAFCEAADILENADNFDMAVHDLIKEYMTKHQRIIFNGDGYSQEWKEEAARRGLSNLTSTAEALPASISQKNLELFSKHGVFSETELRARYEIHLENYCKIINIEALTSVDMVMQQILPAAMRYSSDLANGISRKKAVSISAQAETDLLQTLSVHTDTLYALCQQLKADLKQIPNDKVEAVTYFRSRIVADMDAMRTEADTLEQLTDKSYWPYPTYSDLLFY